MVAQDKSRIVSEVPLACADELAAVEFMERLRWGDRPACPRCGDLDVRKMEAKGGGRNARFLWRCGGCKRQFTVRIGTVLEDSRIPLRHWCFAFWAACASKKGVSAMQIKRQTGLSYKSALFMMHRIRFAMRDTGGPKLKGTVEADETYVGGKPRKPGRAHPLDSNKPQRTNKTAVVALVQRGGGVRAFPVKRVTAKTLGRALTKHVDMSSRIMTDEHAGYRATARRFKGGHHTVKHSHGEYARGDVYSNTVESFFSLIKRGVYGTFHSVSKQHLHRYVDEFAFRWNTRKVDDGFRMVLAVRGAEGKRLTYA